jgi:hypothetical protein
MNIPRTIALALAALLPARATLAQQQARPFTYRWVYMAQNLLVPANVQAVQALMQRAAAAGYNGVVLADYKLQILDTVPASYATNLAAVKASADQLGLAIYPMTANVGYAEGILSHNPNLVEAQPVNGALFVAQAGNPGTAVHTPDPAITIDGGFEQHSGNTFTAWSWQDEPGVRTFADTATRHSGACSVRMVPSTANTRIVKIVLLAPFRQYHLSAWVKSQSLAQPGNVNIQAISASGQVLSFVDVVPAPTQDWTQAHVIFNSGDATSVNIYFGVWGGTPGTIWFDDAAIDEVGLLNVVRRPGAPLVVRAESGGTIYEEGIDFQPISDPRMGNQPWPGAFEVWHTPPQITLTPGSAIAPGQRLRVSFYHAITTDSGKTALCPSEPQSRDLLESEMSRIAALLHPPGFFLAHDEIRVMNHCGACRARNTTAGAILAENVRTCESLAQQFSATGRRAPVFVWSDMFDPSHNAVPSYYLARGTLANSWQGLNKSTVIVNWNSGHAAQSLAFFKGLGFPQILAGYYDGDPASIRGWLATAKSLSVPVEGVMYTTWSSNYTHLEAFAAAAWGP